MFPGGNTSRGFFSFYSYIIRQEDAKRVFILKGGPGVGKSTFMRKVAAEMLEHGYDVEFMQCSSDNNSLDGILIPKIGVAMIDGTAPHVVDPKNPGAVDEIINLGDFWNEEALRENKEAILNDNNEVGRTFKRAYRYIKAAYSIYEDNEDILSNCCIKKAKVNKVTENLVKSTFDDKKSLSYEGKDRCLFASAITPKGLVNYLHTLIDTGQVYIIKGMPGTGTQTVLQKLKDTALLRGFDTESFYCALNPLKIEHLIIPQLDISFTTSNVYHNVESDGSVQIDFDNYLDAAQMEKYRDILELNRNNFELLLNQAVDTIAKAKKIHDRIENYYIPNMDFTALQKCYEDILKRVFKYVRTGI